LPRCMSPVGWIPEKTRAMAVEATRPACFPSSCRVRWIVVRLR
jgi:hypothetical protein